MLVQDLTAEGLKGQEFVVTCLESRRLDGARKRSFEGLPLVLCLSSGLWWFVYNL